jgi:hypothetical protein
VSIAAEFPDYDLTTLPPIPADWEDHSWHNDAAPSWHAPGGFNVWVDYLDPAMREIPGGLRFIVHKLDGDGCFTSDEPAIMTDDWVAVLAFVVDPIAALCAEYEAWNAAQGLNLGSADEHLFDESLSPEQRQWVKNFSRRWESVARG